MLSILREKEKRKLFKPTQFGGKVALAYAIAGKKLDGEKLRSIQAV